MCISIIIIIIIIIMTRRLTAEELDRQLVLLI